LDDNSIQSGFLEKPVSELRFSREFWRPNPELAETLVALFIEQNQHKGNNIPLQNVDGIRNLSRRA